MISLLFLLTRECELASYSEVLHPAKHKLAPAKKLSLHFKRSRH